MACPTGWNFIGTCTDYSCSTSSCDNPAYAGFVIQYKHTYDRCSQGGTTKCYYVSSTFEDCECR